MMEIYSDIEGIREFLKEIKLQKKSIGFVPTMGALHEGHLELIRKSREQNDFTICSIFVNPTQFNNPKDLKNYPREIDADLGKLNKLNCSAAFIPPANTMYEENYIMNFDFGYMEEIMEGRFRPGHFKGVSLIVSKLFNIINPNRAYFGRKDLQQLSIVKTLTNELLFDIEIVPVDTVREDDGLAMSSRNKLLSPTERPHAADIYRALTTAKNKLNGGESVLIVKEFIRNFFKKSSKITLEYFEIVKTSDLRNINEIETGNEVSICIAGYLGKVRLIDNISLI